MAVVVKVSDVIKLLKEIRDDGIKEICFYSDNGDDEDPPTVHIDGVDPSELVDSIDCGEIEGRIDDGI